MRNRIEEEEEMQFHGANSPNLYADLQGNLLCMRWTLFTVGRKDSLRLPAALTGVFFNTLAN